jgi:type I restriction enzyme, S subunit
MSEWRERRLEDVVQLKRGFDLATRDRRPGPFPVVGSAGISGWHDEGPIPGPALVLGRAGSSMGVASYCETTRFWPLNTTLFVEDFKGNDPRFIFHLFQLTDLTGYNSGSAQPMLNRNYIRDFIFLVPGIEEQRAISDVLKALDDKIAVNNRIIGSTNELSSTLFEDFLLSDSGCSEALLSDIADVNRRKIVPVAGGTLRYIDISSVSIGRVEWPELTSWEDAPGRARRGVSPGDTIWSTVRPNRKSFALILDDDPALVVSTGFAVLTPTKVGPAFLYEVTKRDAFTQYLESVSEGSAYPAVRAERFGQATIPMLSPDRLEEFESIAINLRLRSHAADRQSRMLAALRDELLPKLMSGEIRVRDAEKVVEDVT